MGETEFFVKLEKDARPWSWRCYAWHERDAAQKYIAERHSNWEPRDRYDVKVKAVDSHVISRVAVSATPTAWEFKATVMEYAI